MTGGSSYRLGDVRAHAATWTPDGEWITYANGGDLFHVMNDGSKSLKLLSVCGTIDWPRWSPDGNRLRFTVGDTKTPSPKMWERAADGPIHIHCFQIGINRRASVVAAGLLMGSTFV